MSFQQVQVCSSGPGRRANGMCHTCFDTTEHTSVQLSSSPAERDRIHAKRVRSHGAHLPGVTQRLPAMRAGGCHQNGGGSTRSCISWWRPSRRQLRSNSRFIRRSRRCVYVLLQATWCFECVMPCTLIWGPTNAVPFTCRKSHGAISPHAPASRLSAARARAWHREQL